jgi:hypothetical protein
MVDDYERLLKELPDGVSETEMSRKLWEAQVSCDVCLGVEYARMCLLASNTPNFTLNKSVLHLLHCILILVTPFLIPFACLDVS